MSKSLGNGIYLADDMDTLQKVMSMYTDPNHIRVEDPGKIEGNMVFHYLDVFGREEDRAEIEAMKNSINVVVWGCEDQTLFTGHFRERIRTNP